MADDYDLVIIGFGSAGMVAAEFAASLDLNVAIVERQRVGGDCLWTGCVPSKALLSSAKVAHHMRHADHWGIEPVEPTVDTAKVWSRIRSIQQQIADADDNAPRFEAMGLDIVFGNARVTGPNEVTVELKDGGSRTLTTRYILLCTGSRPIEPDIEGIAEAGYITSETLFELDRAPDSMVIVGGGPIAIEMAQGFQRLGLPATVLQKGPSILPRDEFDLVQILQKQLVAEGVDLCLDVHTERATIEPDGRRRTIHGTQAGVPKSWTAHGLLVAVGRRPNVDGMGLEQLGVEVGPKGVVVDERLRTNVRTIYAAGDVAGRYLFTHSAGYEGVRAIRDMFFPGKGKADELVPWCTFTDPELAHAGMTSNEASEKYGDDAMVWRQDLMHNDRARAEGTAEGAVVIVTGPKRKIIGAHILAPGAGEMLQELSLAIREELKLAQIAGLIHVYPTVSTGIGQLAGEAAFEGAQKYKWLVRRGKR
jgi:pyruvate/2-oxoglutarate dehydrogenase complex dihydrolipoamide dehydrogenase (E3) component